MTQKSPKIAQNPPKMTQNSPKRAQFCEKCAKNTRKICEKCAKYVERRTYVSPDILRLKPENMDPDYNSPLIY